MEAGTFTIVDQVSFCPVSQIKEPTENTNAEHSDNDSDDSSDSRESVESNSSSHRKEVRRKSDKSGSDNSSESSDESTDDEIKSKAKSTNEFEFCETSNKNVEIKQEVVTEEEVDKSSESSDDDVPLASLDKTNFNKQEKRSNDSEDETSVKRLKVNEDGTGDNEKIYQCFKCDTVCKTRKKYKSHVRKVHGKRFKCKLCLQSFDDAEILKDHYNIHTGERPYICCQCDNMTFKTERSLKRHTNLHHSDQPIKIKGNYECHFCKKVLSTPKALEMHLRLHTGEKPFVCHICNKGFARINDLKQHMDVHEELYKCKYCNRSFATPYQLKTHTRKHTGETPYECDKCDRKFARSSDFRYHVGTHLGIKAYKCDLCDMKFTSSSSANRHRLNSHASEPKKLACPYCPRSYHTETRLRGHIKTHENKNRFKCELCPATRNSLSELNRHALTHSVEFRCDTCNRVFASAKRLASHTSRHDITGKPYACFVCSLGYRSSQSLNKHFATVHPDEDIPKIVPQHLCTLCGQVFEMKDKLNRHLKENHIVIVIGEIHSLDEEVDNKPSVKPVEVIKTIKPDEPPKVPVEVKRSDEFIEIEVKPIEKPIDSVNPSNAARIAYEQPKITPNYCNYNNYPDNSWYVPKPDLSAPQTDPKTSRLDLSEDYRYPVQSIDRQPIDRDKYYYNMNPIHDRTKYAHLNYQNIPRDYMQSPMSAHDLSNHSNSQSPNYSMHTFPAPHFFPFRDLQQRMLGVNYAQNRHLPIIGMDMTNRLNPSPISPYQNHVVDSPMSRSSYEDLNSAHTYHLNQNQPRIENKEEMNGGGPYEMKVAN